MLLTCRLSHNSRLFNRDTPGKCSEMTTSCCSGCNPHSLQSIARFCTREIPHTNWLRTTLTYFLNTTRYAVTRRTHEHGSRVNSLSGRRRLGLSMETILDPDRRLVSEGLLGGYGYTWVMTPQETSESSAWRIFLRWYMLLNTMIVPTVQKRPEEAPSASRSSWQACGEHGTPTWKISGTQGTASFWEKAEAPLPPPRPRCNFLHSKQLSPFPERLKLPFSIDEDPVRLRGYCLLRHRPIHYAGENRP